MGAEFESQIFIVLFSNPACNLLQGRPNPERFWTGWVELYALVTSHEFNFEAHLSHAGPTAEYSGQTSQQT